MEKKDLELFGVVWELVVTLHPQMRPKGGMSVVKWTFGRGFGRPLDRRKEICCLKIRGTKRGVGEVVSWEARRF